MWCVSKHDAVSRNAKLIERSYERMAHQPQTVRCCDDNQQEVLLLSDNAMILDPQKNVPLKLHVCEPHEIPLLSRCGDRESEGGGWRPPLRLTGNERTARHQEGTTLLLGRSGTGKTLCLMDRMTWDRTHSQVGAGSAGEEAGLRQLFVSRNGRLVDIVRRLQRHRSSVDIGGSKHSAQSSFAIADYVTLETFLSLLQDKFPIDTEQTPVIDFSREDVHVTYQKFREVVYPRIRGKHMSLDAIVVSTYMALVKAAVLP